MKKSFFILLGLLLCISGFAQLKHFLPHTNGVMSILNQKYWFDGDTIIEGTRYTKVYRQHCYSEMECGELGYYAAVREDTIAEKIYAVFAKYNWFPYREAHEVLLADFAVQSGDEVMVYSDWWPNQYPACVESVDEVLIDGRYRKRVNLVDDRGYGNGESWVEGIGSVKYGLFFPHITQMVDAGAHPAFLCLHIDDALIYQNSRYETCYLKGYDVNLPKIDSGNFIIYPIPVNDILCVDTDVRSYLYKIYNVQAKVVQSGLVSNSPIDASLLNSGIYLIEFYSDIGLRLYSGKFVKR